MSKNWLNFGGASHRNVPVKDRPETTFCSFPLSCNSFSIRLTLFMMCGPITVFWSVILVVTRCLSTPQFGTPRSQLIGLRILTSLSFRVWISLRQIQRMHMPTCGPKLKQLRLSRLGSLLNHAIRKSQLGRGQTFDTYPRKGFPPPRHLKPSRKGDIQPQYEGTSAQHSQWFRQLRRVQAYCRFKKSNPVDLCNAHGASLWRSIVQAKGFQHGFPFWWEHHCTTLLSGAPDRFPLIPPGYDVAELIFSSLTLEVRSLENRLKASRAAKLRKQRAETAHLVFRDCKAEQPDRVDLFVSHRQSTVTQVGFSEQSITIDPPVQFLSDSQCFINGQESWVLS